MPEAAGGRPPRLVLAFDFGQRRIGVARGDTISGTTAPLPGVPADRGEPRWECIDSLVRDWRPALAIVGLPYNADGSEGTAAAAARAFAAEIERRYALPVRLVDERYSSLEAGARLRDARQAGRRKRRVAKTDIDAAAACVILERWIGEET